MNKLIKVPGFEMYACPKCGTPHFSRHRDDNYCITCGESLKDGLQRNPVNGMWIDRRHKLFLPENYNCPICNTCSPRTDYCPSCGADLRDAAVRLHA